MRKWLLFAVIITLCAVMDAQTKPSPVNKQDLGTRYTVHAQGGADCAYLYPKVHRIIFTDKCNHDEAVWSLFGELLTDIHALQTYNEYFQNDRKTHAKLAKEIEDLREQQKPRPKK